jgi:hypothetical protein
MLIRVVFCLIYTISVVSCSSAFAQNVSLYTGIGLRTTLNYQNTVLTETRLQVGSPDFLFGALLPFDKASDLSGQIEYAYASYATKNIEGAPLNLIVPRFLMETSLQYHTLKLGLSLANLGFDGMIQFGGKIGLPAHGRYTSTMDIFQTGRIFASDSGVQVRTDNMQQLIEMYGSISYRITNIAGQPLHVRFDGGYVFGELLQRNLPLDVLAQQGLLGYRTLGIQPVTLLLSLTWALPVRL